MEVMASRTLDEFENDWTFVDKDGKVDIEVSYVFNFVQIVNRNVPVLREFFTNQATSPAEFCFSYLGKFLKTV